MLSISESLSRRSVSFNWCFYPNIFNFSNSVLSPSPISFPFFSSLNGPNHSPFGHSSHNLYNHYASPPYATYTAPQYTTANPNRCPSNSNDKTDRNDADSRTRRAKHQQQQQQQPVSTQAASKYGRHMSSRTSKLDNGNDIAVANNAFVTRNERRMFNETVIEEGQSSNNSHVS